MSLVAAARRSPCIIHTKRNSLSPFLLSSPAFVSFLFPHSDLGAAEVFPVGWQGTLLFCSFDTINYEGFEKLKYFWDVEGY